jgi:hypothetical protein
MNDNLNPDVVRTLIEQADDIHDARLAATAYRFIIEALIAPDAVQRHDALMPVLVALALDGGIKLGYRSAFAAIEHAGYSPIPSRN